VNGLARTSWTGNGRWIARGVALAAAIAGIVAFVAWPRRAPSAPPFTSAPVERGAVVARVTASGTLSARRTVLVSSQVSGRLAAVLVDFNAPVRRGQVLARIDPQPFAAAVAQAEANAAAAEATVEKARAKAAELERQVGRDRALAARQLVATAELETAESELAMARAELSGAQASVAQAAAALAQARFNLSMTSIRSPIDGLVVSRDVDEGQTVAASLQAPTLFTLAEDLRSMQVKAHVSESDVGRIAVGMPASFTVSAFPKQPFDGSVRQVRTSAQTTENVVTYDVIVDAENPALRLKPGMTATVTFTIAERRDVLRVPNAALRFRPPGATPAPTSPPGDDRKLVHVVTADALRPIPVEVGVTDGTYTEITAPALAAGMLVATQAAPGGSSKVSAPRPPAGGPPGVF